MYVVSFDGNYFNSYNELTPDITPYTCFFKTIEDATKFLSSRSTTFDKPKFKITAIKFEGTFDIIKHEDADINVLQEQCLNQTFGKLIADFIKAHHEEYDGILSVRWGSKANKAQNKEELFSELKQFDSSSYYVFDHRKKITNVLFKNSEDAIMLKMTSNFSDMFVYETMDDIFKYSF